MFKFVKIVNICFAQQNCNKTITADEKTLRLLKETEGQRIQRVNEISGGKSKEKKLFLTIILQ